MNKNALKTAKTLLVSFSLILASFSNVYAQKKTQNSGEIDPRLQQNLTIVVSEHDFDLNPHTSSYSLEAQILTGLYEGLFSYDPVTLSPLPALAKEYRISRDKRRWTFILRDDAFFSDGSPITANEIKSSWLRLLKNPDATFASFFDIVEGAEDFRNGKTDDEKVGVFPVDAHTLSLHLKNPASHLPKLLCMPAFSVLPKKEGVYSGPFQIDSASKNMISLKKNENYWDRAKTPLERITFIVSSDQDENAYLFNTGLADWVESGIDVKKIISKDSTHLSAEFATEYIFFKNRTAADGKKSIWSDKKFREALLEAVPWDKLREDTFVKAQTLVYPLAGYPEVQGYVYTDAKEALSLMKEARAKNGISEDETLYITYAITENEHLSRQKDILKEAWKPLGVELEPIKVPFNEYLGSMEKLDSDLFSYTWIGDFADPLAFLELFKKDSTMNVTGWENQEFEKLIEEAKSQPDGKREILLAKAEQILLDDAEIIPVQHPVSFNVIDLNVVGGWATNAFDIHPLKYLFKKETKPRLPNVVMNSD